MYLLNSVYLGVGIPCVQKLSNKLKCQVSVICVSLQYSLHFIYPFGIWWCSSLHSLIKLYTFVHAQNAADSTHMLAHIHSLKERKISWWW